jgi:glycosyltransferase involved in cell wall biosynthesis
MEALFLIQDERMPSSRVRVVNLLPELRRADITPVVQAYPQSWTARVRLWRTCRHFDVVVLQKKMPAPWDLFWLRRASRLLVFDFDDAIYLHHDARASLGSQARLRKFKAVTRAADLVIAGNPFLAAKAAAFNPNVAIVPSSVPTRGVPVRSGAASGERVTIGWIGTSGNLHHLEMITPALRELSKETPMTLRVVSDRSSGLAGLPLEFVKWSLDSQEAAVAAFDIGVMPLPATPFSEGKCGYKALQYMAAAVPPVVSDVGVNREIVEHRRSGLVLAEPADFLGALRELIQRPSFRDELGRNARERAEGRYSIEVVGRQLAGLLGALSSSP